MRNKVIEALHVLQSAEEFRYGMDRTVYKRALRRANAWRNQALASDANTSEACRKLARKFDAERLIFLSGIAFLEERGRLIELLDQVGKVLSLAPTTARPVHPPRIVKEVKVVESPVPQLARLLEDHFAISLRTLRAQLTRITTDLRLRAIIFQGISEAVVNYCTACYKSAAIMAGSASEGLLLAALGNCEEPAVKAAFAKVFPNRRPKLVAHMTYDEMTDVASELGLLLSGTRYFSRGIKDFRNLVHPELELREGASITPAAAEMAIKSVLLVLHDLAFSFSTPVARDQHKPT